MSGNVGASMEFTARVGSILRGLLPRCWITESGSQRLDGLFECLLQKAAVPTPTFYGATLSCVLEIVSRRLCIHIALEIGLWPSPPATNPLYPWPGIGQTLFLSLFGRFHSECHCGSYRLWLPAFAHNFMLPFGYLEKSRFRDLNVEKLSAK